MRVWIGGGPCGGKSSVADRIAQKHRGSVYHADEHFLEHGARAPKDTVLGRVAASSFAQLFARDVAAMVADYVAVSQEEFPMIVEDLPDPGPEVLVVEGAALLPSLLRDIVAPEDVAVVLAPAEAFQRRVYAERPWIAGLLNQVADPERVWESWRRRDVAFSTMVREEAVRAGIPVIDVDGTEPIDAIADRAWGLVGHAGV